MHPSFATGSRYCHPFEGEYANRTACGRPGRHHASMDGAKPVQVLFPPDEYAAVARHADHLGISVAEFIRRAATVHAGQEPDTCGSGGARRAVVVPPVRRGAETHQAPALQRFLDTLTTTDPARVPQQQPTVRSCSGT